MRAQLLPAILALALVPGAAQAADDWAWAKAVCPRKSDGSIDATRYVDKDALASAALDKAGVPRRLERLATIDRGGLNRLTRWETMVALNRTLCDGSSLCIEGDADKLGQASSLLAFVLSDSDDFSIDVADTHPGRFFFDDASQIRCKPAPAQTAAGQGAEKTKQAAVTSSQAGDSGTRLDLTPFAWSRFRVRGSSADLVYERGTSGFSDADKSTISYGDEDGKRSTKLVLAAGYAQGLFDGFLGTDHVYGTLLPYVAANLAWSKKGTAARDVSSDTVEFGTVFEAQRSAVRSREDGGVDHFEHYLAITPHLITNYHDHSQVAGGNILYRPAYVGGLNSLVEIANTGLWWEAIADARLNSGIFTRAGIRAADDARDFSRLGGRLGLNVTSAIAGVPADFTATDTFMWALAGHPGHLSRLKADLSLYFTDKKYFGIDLGFSRGRIEDLDDRDNKWTLGIAVKY